MHVIAVLLCQFYSVATIPPAAFGPAKTGLFQLAADANALEVAECISLRLYLTSALSHKRVLSCCNDGAGTRGVLLADYPQMMCQPSASQGRCRGVVCLGMES